jgi:hypothetical protein
VTGVGYVARWQGDCYEASPAVENGKLVMRIYSPTPASGFTECGEHRFVQVVLAGDLEGLSYVREICEWRGEPFYVVARSESGELLLEYAGATGGQVAAEIGLTRAEPGVHRHWVSVDAVGAIRRHEIVLA